jgi:hypothetical protein
MAANGWRYETLGISELLHYQGTTDFDARTEAQITTSPPMFYDRVLAPVIFYLLVYSVLLHLLVLLNHFLIH